MTLSTFLRKAFHRIGVILVSFPYEIKKKRLARIYANKPVSSAMKHGEEANIENIQLGRRLRDEVLLEYQGKFRSKPYRILFHIPPSGVGKIWFRDLIVILQHTGIPCATVDWNDPEFSTKWTDFQPDVFISMDHPLVLKSLNLDFINLYKRERGIFRLMTPTNKSHYPDPRMSKEDLWRFDLAKSGRSVDAYFCMFEEDYFNLFWPEWKQLGFQYLSLPHGCNPLYQYPRPAARDLDYFMATSCGPERVDLTLDYMKEVFRKYDGLWAGPDWGFGMGAIDAKDMPDFYARARIIPNPLARFLIQYPAEITERAFSATACGAFQITDWTPVTDRFYASDELITVTSKVEFLEKFEYYISRPDERNLVIQKGLRRVFSEHTYFHRVDRLIAFLDANQQFINESPSL